MVILFFVYLKMLQERQRIEASPTAATVSPMSSSPPHHDENNGVFASQRNDNKSADNSDYFLGEVSVIF